MDCDIAIDPGGNFNNIKRTVISYSILIPVIGMVMEYAIRSMEYAMFNGQTINSKTMLLVVMDDDVMYV